MRDDAGIRVQDGARTFIGVAAGGVGRYLAWDFIRDNWDAIVERFSSGIFMLPTIMSTLKEGYNTRLDLEQLKAFYEKNRDNLSDGKRELEQAIEQATANVAWMDNNYDVIVSWLEKRQP